MTRLDGSADAAVGRVTVGDAYTFAPALVTVSDPNGPQAEAIRGMRTHIMAQHVNRGRRALAICAPSLDVGCTFVATNLAIALSQIGVKTLLIDGDLQRPGINHLVRAPRTLGGLAYCLATPDANFSDNINADVLPDLSILYAGQPVANPQELLAGDRFKTLMDFCLRDYDVTIVDTPPGNTSSDVRRISTVVGYSLIVAGRDKTFVRDVKILADQLRADHARVVGTVFNQA